MCGESRPLRKPTVGGVGWEEADSSLTEPGDGLHCTHCTSQYCAASASTYTQYSLSSIVFLLPPLLSVSSSGSYKSVLILLFSCSMSFPFLSFAHSPGFFQSRCAGCWPPITTGGPKSWCCVSPRRTRLTWPPSHTQFWRVRGGKPRRMMLNLFSLLGVRDEMNMQQTQRHWLTHKETFICASMLSFPSTVFYDEMHLSSSFR